MRAGIAALLCFWLLLAPVTHTEGRRMRGGRRTAWSGALVDEVITSLKALGMKLTTEQEFAIVQRLKLIISSRNVYYPSRGRGVLMMGNSVQLRNAYITLRILRDELKSNLPVEVAYNGEEEAPSPLLQQLIEDMDNVRLVDSSAVQLPAEVYNLFNEEGQEESRRHGYSQKIFTLAYVCSFSEVVLLDTDNLPLLDPDKLFNLPAYRQHGNMFWPDWWTHDEDFVKMEPGLYNLLNIPVPWETMPEGTYRAAESGQVVFERHRHRDVLQWLWWLAANHNITDRFMHGDKDLFRVAFILAGKADAYQQVTIPARQAVGLRKGQGNQEMLKEHMGMVQMTPDKHIAFHHRTAGSKYWPNCVGRFEECRVVYITPSLSHDDAARNIGNMGIWREGDIDVNAWQNMGCHDTREGEQEDAPETRCDYLPDRQVPLFELSTYGRVGRILQAAHELVVRLSKEYPEEFGMA